MRWLDFLRYCGEHSIVIYLAFFLPMATARSLLLKFAGFLDIGIGYFNAAMRLTPPLRQVRDRDALRAGLADGTIDALVSDHTPVDEDAKTLPFAEAEPGATGRGGAPSPWGRRGWSRGDLG
eukprot:gene40740-55082_t